MKRTWQAALLACVLLLLAATWFVVTHERVETRVWVGPTPAARANPYLATMRFVERLGMKATVARGPARLDTLDPRATILLPARRSGLSPVQAQALARWMERGGHAIVEPEPTREIDVVLDRFGIARADPGGRGGETMRSEWPGRDDALTVSWRASPVLRFERAAPDLAVASEGGIWLASLPVGAGRLTVMSGMDRLTNRNIGTHDHAEVLRRTVALSPAAHGFVVVRLPSGLPLWDWMREHALPTLAAAGVLMLLWLARTLPRFGPIQPEPPVQRRQLLEHLLAAGRFRWLHGGRDGLLGAAREVCHRHAVALQPRLAHLAPERRWQEIADKCGLEAAAVAAAFSAEARTAREFVHIVGTLASIHARLGRPADPNASRPLPRS